jgi:peptide/nickel transport system substrate-binding protein
VKKNLVALQIILLIVVILFSFSYFGCKKTNTESQESGLSEESVATTTGVNAGGSTITMGCNSIVRTLDPVSTICSEEKSLVNNMYDKLVSYNKDDPNTVKPEIAESWEVSEDASTWTFHLRKGVKFSTGNELTAEDVVFSLSRGIEKNEPCYPPFGKFIDPKTSFEIVDNYTLKIKLIVPFVAFDMLLSRPEAGIIDKKSLEAHMTKDDPFGFTYLNENSLGSGPFVLKEWIKDQKIVLVKNADYWGIAAGYFRAPKYDTFVDLNVKEPSVQKMMLEKSDIDFTTELPRDMIQSYQSDSNKDVKIEEVQFGLGASILMNMKYEQFADQNVRNAIRYAINYDKLIKDVLLGIREDRPLFKPQIGTDDDILYGYDPAKAKDFLSKSKYPDGFTFSLAIGTGLGIGADWETMALVIKEDLSKIGITMNIEQYDWSVMDEKLFKGNYQAEMVWYASQMADSEGMMYQMARSDGINLAGSGYVNKEVDDLANQAMVEKDKDKRYQIYRKISEIFAQDGPYACIAQEIKGIAFRNNVNGFDKNPAADQMDFAVLYKQ